MASKEEKNKRFLALEESLKSSMKESPQEKVKSPAEIAASASTVPENKQTKADPKESPEKEKKPQVRNTSLAAEKAPKQETEAQQQEKKRRGRPKSENPVVKRRITLDLDEKAVEDVNKIIGIMGSGKDKLSLTRVIENALREFALEHKDALDAYNRFNKIK